MGVDTTHAADDAGPDSAAAALARVSFVSIPQHLWTIDVARDPAAFTHVLGDLVIVLVLVSSFSRTCFFMSIVYVLFEPYFLLRA